MLKKDYVRDGNRKIIGSVTTGFSDTWPRLASFTWHAMPTASIGWILKTFLFTASSVVRDSYDGTCNRHAWLSPRGRGDTSGSAVVKTQSSNNVRTTRISKSRFIAGCQCLKRLYWQVHEPELAAQPDAATEAIIEQGRRSGCSPGNCFRVDSRLALMEASIRRSAPPVSLSQTRRFARFSRVCSSTTEIRASHNDASPVTFPISLPYLLPRSEQRIG